jgi:hypothetical protein
MPPATEPQIPLAYRTALEGLAEAVREAHALADVLEHFARQLRGLRPNPEGLPPEGCPVPSWVRRALERRERALAEAVRVYEGLPNSAREGLLPPEELLQEGDG